MPRCLHWVVEVGRGWDRTAVGSLSCNPKASQARRFRPANCGFRVAWSDVFRDRYEGQPLKGVTLSSGSHTARGDMIITRAGIEGGAVYAISAPLRDAIDRSGETTLRVALRPDLEISDLVARLSAPRNKQSLSTYLRKQLSLRLWPSDCCRKRPLHWSYIRPRCRQWTLRDLSTTFPSS